MANITIEKLQIQLDKNDYWIQNVDTKVSVILTFLGVLSGYILAMEDIEKLFDVQTKNFQWIPTLLFIVTAILISISIYYSFKGLRANTKNHKPGLWFFGDVAQFEHTSHFARKKIIQTEEEYKEDIINQIYNTAKIANEKFKFFNKSLTWTKYSVLSYLLFFAFNNII